MDHDKCTNILLNKVEFCIFFGNNLNFQIYIWPNQTQVREDRMRMEDVVYKDILDSLRSRSWGDLDTLQEEICQDFPEVETQSIRSILHQESDLFLDPSLTSRSQKQEVC